MPSNDISGSLAALANAHKQTVHLIHRLQRLSFQPGNVSSEADFRVELSTEIHQSLKEQEEELELLRQEVEGYLIQGSSNSRRRSTERYQEKERMAATAAKLGEDLKSARSQFRKAQLQAKRNAEDAKRNERKLLFSGAGEGGNSASGRRKGQGQERLTQDELMVNASSDITAALRRTHQLMQAELSRSQFAQETLEQSTAALTSLPESYTNLDTLLSSSRSLVSTLLRSQKSDTWYLETAFYVLVVTICWLLFRRIFYGPLWWLVWMPIKFLYRFGVVALSATGMLGAMGVDQSNPVTARTSLIIQPSATGGPPTFAGTMRAPSIVVGGGNRGGGFGRHTPSSRSEQSNEGLADQLERLAEEGQRERQQQQRPPRQPEEKPEREEQHGEQQGERGTGIDDISEEERRRQEQIPRNPKKRMFEADVEWKKMKERDEL